MNVDGLTVPDIPKEEEC